MYHFQAAPFLVGFSLSVHSLPPIFWIAPCGKGNLWTQHMPSENLRQNVQPFLPASESDSQLSVCQRKKYCAVIQKQASLYNLLLSSVNLNLIWETIYSVQISVLQENYRAQLEPMMQQFVVPAFGSKHGHLRAKACWMTGKFADISFTDGTGYGPTFMNFFSLAVKALQDAELPVRLACTASD